MLQEIVFLTTYPPQECGIATFSQDLVQSLNSKFRQSFDLRIAVLENGEEQIEFPKEVKYALNTADEQSYINLANVLNDNDEVALIAVQHEFGLYHGHEEFFIEFLSLLKKPVVIVFHTVLPHPNQVLKQHVENIAYYASDIVVMTENAQQLLSEHYIIPREMISVIQHGTHLIHHHDKNELKEKHGFAGRKVLSTFGLMSSGKNIESSLNALPAVIAQHPDVLFLVIGKTHPNVIKHEGEKYRESLEALISELGIENNVQFINRYTSLPELLEFLQLTDIYLFSSKDPNQAVSGTLSYALSCGCPIVSTPIAHAQELVSENVGIIVPYDDNELLSASVIRLLSDEQLRTEMGLNALHMMAATSWENSAVAYASLFKKAIRPAFKLEYSVPEINLQHMQKLTNGHGMFQFSKINQPDPESGYTLDDNARALIAMCQHYELTKQEDDLKNIRIYLSFIVSCQHSAGYFMNYVDERKAFTDQNFATNLSDSNGRAIWALGYMISLKDILPEQLTEKAEKTMKRALLRISGMNSPRAMCFAIKGLRYYNSAVPSFDTVALIMLLANRMVHLYRNENSETWKWFESYLTYANSVLPEAMLCAYEATGNAIYREIAKRSFDFLISHTFTAEGIRVISNKNWMTKGEQREFYGEQPIDVAYTVLALSRFYQVFGEVEYLQRMESAFNWFLGCNHLGRMIYNPCTGGCMDGLEETHVNLNQGAESTVSYLMARMTMEQHKEALRELNGSDLIIELTDDLQAQERLEQRKKELTAEFATITRQMEEFPELYVSLSESPLFISNHEEETSIEKFENYLETLRSQLRKYTENPEIGKVS